jgi:hypothetical protein
MVLIYQYLGLQIYKLLFFCASFLINPFQIVDFKHLCLGYIVDSEGCKSVLNNTGKD